MDGDIKLAYTTYFNVAICNALYGNRINSTFNNNNLYKRKGKQMTTQNTNGYRLIKNSQLVWAIIMYIIGLVFASGIVYGKITNMEVRVEKLENKSLIDEKCLNEIEKSMNEIKINLKTLMKKSELEYQTYK